MRRSTKNVARLTKRPNEKNKLILKLCKTRAWTSIRAVHAHFSRRKCQRKLSTGIPWFSSCLWFTCLQQHATVQACVAFGYVQTVFDGNSVIIDDRRYVIGERRKAVDPCDVQHSRQAWSRRIFSCTSTGSRTCYASQLIQKHRAPIAYDLTYVRLNWIGVPKWERNTRGTV